MNPSSRAALLALLPLAAACKKTPVPETVAPSASPSVVAAPSAPAPGALSAPAVPAAPTAAVCSVKVAPFVIERGIRADAGLSLTRAGDAVLVGFAKGNGAPFVVRVAPSGAVEPLTVAAGDILSEAPAPGTKRSVARVVPVHAEGATATASVDFSEIDAEKMRRVICGPSEGTLLVDATGHKELTVGDDEMTVECRSVLRKGELKALVSTLGTAPGDGEALSAVATLHLGTDVVATRTTVLKAKEKPSERYAYTMLGFAENAATGREAVTARFNGNVLWAQYEQGAKLRDDSLWLGFPTNPPSAIPLAEESLLVTTLSGKNDVFLARAAYDAKKQGKPDYAKPGKGETLPLPVANEHGLISGFVDDGGHLILAGTEIVNNDKRTNLHVLSLATDAKELPTVKGTMPIGDTDESVPEARLAPLAGNDLLVTYVVFTKASGYVAKGEVLHCD